MTDQGPIPQAEGSRRKITLERNFRAQAQDVWNLWTTAAGIESWWGPDGFEVKVRRLELRPGGAMEYAMTAVKADQIDFLKKAGMQLVNENTLTYTEIVPLRRLAYNHLADFIPGVEPYQVEMVVEFARTPNGTALRLTFDAMHDERWTQLATMGWEDELRKLAILLEK